jgi:hypothetical protein
MQLRRLAENLWVYEQPHVLGGINIGARMTVVRTNEELWLHSPIDTAALKHELDTLGRVTQIVAPNLGHYVGLAEAHATFPYAELFAVPDIAKRLELEARLPESSAGAEIRARRFRGSRIFDETVFLHAPSKTLVLTDLCMNLQKLSRHERVWARLIGIPPRFGTTRFTKLLSRDRAAMRQASQEVLAWDFDRVIVSHGDTITRGG